MSFVSLRLYLSFKSHGHSIRGNFPGIDNRSQHFPSRYILEIVTTVYIIIIILSFDIAPFPYKHAQRRITFHCQRIDVDIHIVN